MWERGKGGFPEQRGIAVECIYWGEYTKQPGCFQTIVFWSFCDGHSALFVWKSHVLLLSACANKAWSCPTCHLLNREHVWIVFQAVECPCTKTGLWFQEVAHLILCPNYRRSLAVEKARVDFLREITTELGRIHGFDDTVEQGSMQTLPQGVWEMVLFQGCMN